MNDTKKRIFIVDGNWYLHRCYFVLPNPTEESLAFSFLRLVFKDACAVQGTHMLIAFDGPKVFRYKVFSQYKANRHNKQAGEGAESKNEVYSYLPYLLSVLTALKIPYIQPLRFEADDVGCSAVYTYKNHEVVIGTKDKDSYQLLSSENVSLYDSSFKKQGKPHPIYIDRTTVEKKLGIPVEQFLSYQTLIGDSIDNIPKVMTKGKAKKLLSTYGSIKQAYVKGNKELRELLRHNLPRIVTNKKLVTLRSDIPIPSLSSLTVPKLPIVGNVKELPKDYYEYVEMIHPSTYSLF